MNPKRIMLDGGLVYDAELMRRQKPEESLAVFSTNSTPEFRVELVARYNAYFKLLKKSEGSLANNLCPDHRDKQAGKPCLACRVEALETALTFTLEELANWHGWRQQTQPDYRGSMGYDACAGILRRARAILASA